jgi:hypothetical protein
VDGCDWSTWRNRAVPGRGARGSVTWQGRDCLRELQGLHSIRFSFCLLLSGPAVALGWRGNDGIAPLPLDPKVLDSLRSWAD